MRLDTTFRVSFYVTLGLACACLAQAEAYFHPWFAWGSLPLVVLIFVFAWRHEGQWIIEETASNYLGIFIGLATLAWIILQMPRSDAEILASGIPWPAGLLPHLGLLLLMLLAVKLFRPKLLSDFWVIQTMGLMVVTLACVLAGELLFAGLLLAYLASLIWCLALFQLYRAQRPVAAPLFAPVGAPPATTPMPWRQLGLVKTLRWSAAVMLIGLPLFLVMPRSATSQWVPQKLSSAAGTPVTAGIETGINLNRVGTVELSPNPAFHVTVTDANGAPVELDSDQLWRMDVLDYYNKGRWMTLGQAQEYLRMTSMTGPPSKVLPKPPTDGEGGMPPAPLPPPGGTTEPAPSAAPGPVGLPVGKLRAPLLPAAPPPGTRPIAPSVPPPNLRQRFLSFAVRPTAAGGLVLAEPVDLRHVGLSPRVGDEPPPLALFQDWPGTDSAIAYLPMRRNLFTYGQVIDRVPGALRHPARGIQTGYRDYLVAPAVSSEIVAWAQERLADLSQLTPAQRHRDDAGHVAEQHHAAVSMALCRYLALSGKYTYTLNLARHSRTLDPTADFLLNVKAGHCERFATGLTLALRGLGIPARVVKGYRGAEPEQNGKYVIRLDQAHSWVQVLVRDEDGWAWLTLDPTPGDGIAANPLSNWLAWVRDLDPEQLFRRFVLNYNGEVQLSTLHYVGQGIWQSPRGRQLLWQVPAGAAFVVALVSVWRRRRLRGLVRAPRGGPRSSAVPGYYAALLRVLARRLQLRPAPGQTPLEFAVTARAVLAQRGPVVAVWAALPVEATEALYRLRFAGQQMNPIEDHAFRERIAGLSKALATHT